MSRSLRRSSRCSQPAPFPQAAAVDAALTPKVNDVLALFRVIFRSVRRHNRYIEDSTGIGAMQLRALAIIDARPHIGVTELAVAMLVHQPTASKLVETLADSALIQRRRSLRDRRVAELEITPAGTATLDKAPEPVLGLLPDGLGSLDPAELQQLGEALINLVGKLKLRDHAARYEPLTES